MNKLPCETAIDAKHVSPRSLRAISLALVARMLLQIAGHGSSPALLIISLNGVSML
jgi:hypothetical protein